MDRLLIIPTATGGGTNHYTYNGVPMYDYMSYILNDSAGAQKVKRGTGTKEFASAAKNIILSAVGMANTTASLITTGISLLNDFTSNYNLPTPSGSDFVEFSATFTNYTKWTYVDRQKTGQYQLRLVTKNAKLTWSRVDTYFVNSNAPGPRSVQRNHNSQRPSKNYANPKAAAYNNFGDVIKEYVILNIHNIQYCRVV